MITALVLVAVVVTGAIVGAYSLGENQKRLYQQLGRIETPEEYWQWAETSPTFRKEYYSNLFYEHLEEEFREENNYQQADEHFQEKWPQYMNEYKDRAVAEEHLVKVEE